MSKIQPLGGRVLLKPEEVEETTSGGLIIPDNVAEKKSAVGEVVKLGTGLEKEKGVPAVGDKVYFKKYSPEEIDLDGEIYLIIDLEDILAVIK